MMHGNQELFTYSDAVDHLVDFVGSDSGDQARRDARRSAVEALRELVNVHDWTYYYAIGRLTSVANYSTGTIAYDHTGGSSERLLTLSSGTWPSWSARGHAIISSVPYKVESRLSDTTLTLSVNSNPGSDVSSATSYDLYQDTYTLPLDWGKMKSELIDINNKTVLTYTHPRDWLSNTRTFISPSRPNSYTITNDPDFMGAMAVVMSPPSNVARVYDHVYLRKARRLEIERYVAGTVAVTSGANTVTGTDTTFTSDMVGAVIRVGADSTAVTGPYGSNKWEQERVVTGRTNTTTLTVDANWDTTRSGVAYVISDPVDVELGAMLNAYLRTLEKRMSTRRHAGDLKQITNDWHFEVLNAASADDRFSARRQMGSSSRIDWASWMTGVATLGSNN
jgi:hypothetical protein